jgi:hypothetical protein
MRYARLSARADGTAYPCRLLKLSMDIAQSTVAKYMSQRHGPSLSGLASFLAQSHRPHRRHRNGISVICWRITRPTTTGCARTLRSTRIRRSIGPCRESGVSHQSLGSAVSIGTTFRRHNPWAQADSTKQTNYRLNEWAFRSPRTRTFRFPDRSAAVFKTAVPSPMTV